MLHKESVKKRPSDPVDNNGYKEAVEEEKNVEEVGEWVMTSGRVRHEMTKKRVYKFIINKIKPKWQF